MSLVNPGPGFSALLSDFRTSAWRFETQPAYQVRMEQEALHQWLDTGELDVTYLTDWLNSVQAATREGKSYSRVRILTDPPTDYQRFAQAVAPHNVRAGEEIRVLSAPRARELQLPDYDYWLFDDERVAIMHFGQSGLTHAEVIADTDAVTKHRAWRDLAVEHSVRVTAR